MNCEILIEVKIPVENILVLTIEITTENQYDGELKSRMSAKFCFIT